MAASILPVNAFGAGMKRARIIVSLADNVNQGIVPVQPSLGNGQDPKNNLYWGAMYGAKTYFRRQASWNIKTSDHSRNHILDAFLLSHDKYPNHEMAFEAWDGAQQGLAVKAYFEELRDANSENDLICFVGHNALMDLFISNVPTRETTKLQNRDRKRKAAVIACQSAPYFDPHHRTLGVESYVMTQGLMAPEAYVLEGILHSWASGGNANSARTSAAKQYAAYQKIPIRNANWLFGVGS